MGDVPALESHLAAVSCSRADTYRCILMYYLPCLDKGRGNTALRMTLHVPVIFLKFDQNDVNYVIPHQKYNHYMY